MGFIEPGVWEFEIEAEICHEFLRNRSRGPAFETIIASGVDSCTLHYVKNDKQCREGDLVLMDFGAEYANYAADVTRTVPVNGRFSKRQKEVYNAVLNVHKAAIRMLRPGKILDEYTREVGKIMETELIGLGLLDAGEVKKQSEDQPLYKKYFPHGTSHHLGLDVHDFLARYQALTRRARLEKPDFIPFGEELFDALITGPIVKSWRPMHGYSARMPSRTTLTCWSNDAPFGRLGAIT